MFTTKKYIENFTRQLADALKIGQSVDLERPGSDILKQCIHIVGQPF